MKKVSKVKEDRTLYEFKLPGEKITIGPGTVPTSGTSVTRTSIKEMVSGLRKASKDKLFEDKEVTIYGSLQSHNG